MYRNRRSLAAPGDAIFASGSVTAAADAARNSRRFIQASSRLDSTNGVFGERAARLGQRVRSFRGVDVPVRVDGDAFTGRPLIHAVFALERRDERGDAILVERTDAHAVAPVGVVQRTRLRVDGVNGVALDEESAGAPVDVARLDVGAVLVEDLDSMVAAV